MHFIWFFIFFSWFFFLPKFVSSVMSNPLAHGDEIRYVDYAWNGTDYVFIGHKLTKVFWNWRDGYQAAFLVCHNCNSNFCVQYRRFNAAVWRTWFISTDLFSFSLWIWKNALMYIFWHVICLQVKLCIKFRYSDDIGNNFETLYPSNLRTNFDGV